MTVIKTPRLILRPIKEEDAARLALLCNDEGLARNTSGIPFPYTLDHARDFVAGSLKRFQSDEEFRFVACEAEEIVACCGVTPTGDGVHELGYWVGKDMRGRGIASETAMAVCAFAFEEKQARQITAGHFTDNPASGRVLEKLGFERTGEIVPTFSLARGEEQDSVRYSLMASKFTNNALS